MEQTTEMPAIAIIAGHQTYRQKVGKLREKEEKIPRKIPKKDNSEENQPRPRTIRRRLREASSRNDMVRSLKRKQGKEHIMIVLPPTPQLHFQPDINNNNVPSYHIIYTIIS
ncbi:MAG: hypothetical protein ACW98F_14895 [Candidatus Hodarchaeales archaeon]|jgi:hypothetical protein